MEVNSALLAMRGECAFPPRLDVGKSLDGRYDRAVAIVSCAVRDAVCGDGRTWRWALGRWEA
jgi:hypothetical protein